VHLPRRGDRRPAGNTNLVANLQMLTQHSGTDHLRSSGSFKSPDDSLAFVDRAYLQVRMGVGPADLDQFAFDLHRGVRIELSGKTVVSGCSHRRNQYQGSGPINPSGNLAVHRRAIVSFW